MLFSAGLRHGHGASGAAGGGGLEKMEELGFIQQAELAFAFGQNGAGLFFLVADGGLSVGAVVLVADDEKVRAAGDGGS